jgi:phosphoribosyl 1,2-cyclic phosphate phosphodiesterase
LHLNLTVLGFRFGSFSYVTDANSISDSSKKLLQGSDVLVLNALRREKHVSHFNLDEAIELIEELSPKKAYLTHISHQLGLHNEVNDSLPSHIRCAYDGLKVEL